MHRQLTVVDGLQYSNWDRAIFEQLREGGVDAIHVTIAYWENARETLSRIGEWNRRFAANGDLIRPVRAGADVRAARDEGRVGVFYGAQNCSIIEDDIDLVAVFRELGVFLMQLTYNNQSLLGTGCYEDNDTGITRFGREVIREMNRVGMLIDMSHSAERTTLEAVEYSTRPVVVSHANPLFFRDVSRNKSERVLRALAESGGLLGFSAYPLHLGDGSECTLEAYCEMIARTAEIMGPEHLGIGSDLCQQQPDEVLRWMRNGRWRRVLDGDEPEPPRWPPQPAWLRDGRDFPNLTAGLMARGFSREEITGIMGENWLRVLDDGIAAMH
ncbi:membrane dipeptidase [Aquisalimonas sp. 2447]|nr:membrane dipeptidase [Aquisalimonas sp. 2447]